MRRQKVSWWYLSFASHEDVWQGACVVRGLDFEDAMAMAVRLKIAPVGDTHVRAGRFKEGEVDCIPEESRNRLLSKEDLLKYFGELVKWPD